AVKAAPQHGGEYSGSIQQKAIHALFPFHVLPDFLEKFRIMSAHTRQVQLALLLRLGERHFYQTHDQVIVLRSARWYGCLPGPITIAKHRHFLISPHHRGPSTAHNRAGLRTALVSNSENFRRIPPTMLVPRDT